MPDDNILLAPLPGHAATAQAAAAPAPTPAPGLSRALTLILAIACGTITANVYYAQALIAEIGPALHLSHSMAGLVPMLTQIGFGGGLLFIVSLADLLENRRLTLVMIAGAAVATLGLFFAQGTTSFMIFAFLTGFCSVGAQIIVPLAAHLAPEATRGRVIGNIMAGLLTGIMLSRPLANALSALGSWRIVFAVSSCAMVVLGLLLARMLPERRPQGRLSYGKIVASSLTLLVTVPLIRRRAAYQALLFGTFNLFWTAIPLMLAARFGFGEIGIALFALLGAGGALIAPFAGRLADRGYVRAGTLGAIVVCLLSCLLSGWAVAAASLAMLGLAAVALDSAVHSNQILGQRVLFSIHPEARGRINAGYMAALFLSGATGSLLGAFTYAMGGWSAAALTGAAMATLGLILFATDRKAATA